MSPPAAFFVPDIPITPSSKGRGAPSRKGACPIQEDGGVPERTTLLPLMTLSSPVAGMIIPGSANLDSSLLALYSSVILQHHAGQPGGRHHDALYGAC